MKKINMSLLTALFGALLLTACNNSLEERVSVLENKIAEMEDRGVVSSPQATTLRVNQPEASGDVAVSGMPKFQFAEETHDFGTIKEGEVVEHTFKFKNVGDAPLIIQNATASCGCTVPDPPKEPILPGKENEIKVKFDSQNKPGMQNKTITITANTEPSVTRLYIKSNVTPKDQQSAGPVKK